MTHSISTTGFISFAFTLACHLETYFEAFHSVPSLRRPHVSRRRRHYFPAHRDLAPGAPRCHPADCVHYCRCPLNRLPVQALVGATYASTRRWTSRPYAPHHHLLRRFLQHRLHRTDDFIGGRGSLSLLLTHSLLLSADPT